MLFLFYLWNVLSITKWTLFQSNSCTNLFFQLQIFSTTSPGLSYTVNMLHYNNWLHWATIFKYMDSLGCCMYSSLKRRTRYISPYICLLCRRCLYCAHSSVKCLQARYLEYAVRNVSKTNNFSQHSICKHINDLTEVSPPPFLKYFRCIRLLLPYVPSSAVNIWKRLWYDPRPRVLSYVNK